MKLQERVEQLADECFGKGVAVQINPGEIIIWSKDGVQELLKSKTLKEMRSMLVAKLKSLKGETEVLTEDSEVATINEPVKETEIQEDTDMAAKKKTASKKTTKTAKAPKAPREPGREVKLLFRFSKDERKNLGSNAEKAGVPMAQYVRDRCCA